MDDVTQIDRPATAGYDTDFYAWALDQAARIRTLAVPGLDAENVAEEIESLGRSQRSELSNRCRVLLIHLLKWVYQPERRGVSWISTIGEQRDQIQMLLSDSPSLRPTFSGVVANAYRRAIKQAALETSLSPATFPSPCPWTPDQIIDEDWMPADGVD